MLPEKSSLTVRLTEPVVPLRSTPERASRHHDSEMLPPAIVRGLLTLKLAKPTKVSSIELELQAKATTRYAKGKVLLLDHVHTVPLTRRSQVPDLVALTSQNNTRSILHQRWCLRRLPCPRNGGGPHLRDPECSFLTTLLVPMHDMVPALAELAVDTGRHHRIPIRSRVVPVSTLCLQGSGDSFVPMTWKSMMAVLSGVQY
jgi:hypothetical protein